MNEHDWLKVGIAGLVVVGLLALVGLVVTAGDRLEGETWVVDEIVAGSPAAQPLPGTILTAFFEDGSLNGVAGCNSYFAGYEVDGSSIRISPVASTQAFCAEPEGVMEQELAYLGTLGMADRYEIDGDRLTLSRGDEVLIVFYVAKAELLDQ